MTRYTYACTLSWGGDEPTAEVEVEVSYTVAWGSSETGRNGPPEHYDPGSADEIEDIRLEKVEGKPRPWGMYSGYIPNEDDEFATVCVEKIEGDKHHYEAMLAGAVEDDASQAASYFDQERKDSRYEVEYGGPHDGEDPDWY